MSFGSDEKTGKSAINGKLAHAAVRAMRHPNTRALFDYWLQVKGDRLTPYRSELDPRSISELLDSTFILENLDENNVRFRLAGTKLCDKFGMELTGMSALSPWTDSSRRELMAVLNRVVKEPCVAVISCSATVRGQRWDAEFAFMPIRSDFGDISRILGCNFDLVSRPPKSGDLQPPRYEIESVTIVPIETAAAEGDAYATPLPGFGEGAEPFQGKPDSTPPILRAIDGGGKSRRSNGDERPQLRIIRPEE
jgi:hypothetical protein